MPTSHDLHNLLVDIAPHCSVCGALATRRYRDLAPDIHVFRIKIGELSKLAWTPIDTATRSLTLEDIGRRTLNWVTRELAAVGETSLTVITEVQPWSFDQGPFFCDIHTGVYESLEYQDLNIATMVRRATNVGLRAVTEQVRPTRFDRILEDDDDG